MKIVAFSDTHGQQNDKLTQWFESNPADLLIFAGDLQRNNSDYGYEFIDWFRKLPYTYRVMIFGNHDGNSNDLYRYLQVKEAEDVILLNNESIVIEGIKIFGSPYTLKYLNWFFMREDDRLEEIWKLIPDDTNILITHGPPYGILDETFDGKLVGSKTLLDRIKELKHLKYNIFGHVQEAHGMKDVGGVTFLNVSLLNEKYQLVNNPTIISYETGEIETDYNTGE
jgi:Icc-related predicted phosphoesterase